MLFTARQVQENAGSKTLTSTWCSSISPKLLTLLVVRGFGSNSGAIIRFRSDGGVFNLQRLKARTKVSLLLLRELLFADDCALIAKTEGELQSILNDFARTASRYGLTISITKTEVMLQPKLGSSPRHPVIKIGDKRLEAVQTFCYMGGFL